MTKKLMLKVISKCVECHYSYPTGKYERTCNCRHPDVPQDNNKCFIENPCKIADFCPWQDIEE